MRKFSRIYIEITNVCNLNCSFCVGNFRENRFMNVNEFEYIVNQARLFTDNIYLHVLGEPLIHPLLGDFLSIAYKAKLKVNITTNGTLFKDKGDVILSSGCVRKVSVSLHSMEKGSKVSLEDYIREVVLFVKKASEQGIYSDLRLWNLGIGSGDNVEIFELLADFLGIDDVKRFEVRRVIEDVGNVTLAPNLFLGKADRFSWPDMNAKMFDEDIFCYGLRNQVAILCDGAVVPCCLDSKADILLGNIYETDLVDILAGERATALYEGFSKRKAVEELCVRCGYARRFNSK